MGDKLYFTVRELSREKDCPLSEYMIRKMIDENRLPHIKTGHKYLIEKNTFLEWLQSQH